MNGIVRTTLAAAFVTAADPENLRGKRLNKTARKVVHRVLTNKALGVGVKFDPSRKKKPKAETAVEMKVAA